MIETRKRAKWLVAFAAAALMALALAAPAFAQTVSAGSGPATITVSNAAKGETYKVSKLFDATVTGTEGGSIAYTGSIPESLASYFTQDSATGAISAIEGLNLSDAAVQSALSEWAASASGADAVSDGSALEFTGLAYGYYVVTTTQGESAVTVDSTNPTASIVDKNTTTPVANLSKSVDDTDVNIGQTVTYTVSFDTASYNGAGESAKQITSYTITDTPAANALTDITVTGIYVDADANLSTTGDQTPLATQQFTDGAITIPWVEDGASLYANGAKLVITYTATVASTAAIDGAGNANTVAISFTDADGPHGGEGTQYTTTATFYTYAIAIQKVNQAGEALAGATFELPFYVQETAAADGAYVYAGTSQGEGLTNELTTPASGLIVVKGVESGSYDITETAAPNGYNRLDGAQTVTAAQTGSTTTNVTTYLDADGNVVTTAVEGGSTVTVSIADLAATPIVVVNKTGQALPSTGGMGTTVLYLVGGAMIVAAAAVLIAKRRKA